MPRESAGWVTDDKNRSSVPRQTACCPPGDLYTVPAFITNFTRRSAAISDFKHIVHFEKIGGYEGVNSLRGYRSPRIYSPREVVTP